MGRRLALTAAGLVVCATTPGCTFDQPRADAIEIEITHRRAGATWEVFYSLPHPVRELRFARQVNLFRAGEWTIQTEGVRLERRNGAEWLVAEADSGFSSVLLHVPADFEHLPKDYELNVAFSDGAVLLYTGHFDVHSADGSLRHCRFTFRPAPGERVVLRGEVHDGPASETIQSGDSGTYVYFGSSRPIRSSMMLGMVDAELPDWIRRRFDRDLPRLFDFYARQTDRSLDFTPVVYFAYARGDPSRRSLSGGALPGLVQMSARGTGWNREDPSSLFLVLHFIAHEAAHLWNSQAIRHDGGQDAAWMHEGSADAWALRSMAALDLLSPAQVVERHVEAANACVAALSRRPLRRSAAAGQFRDYYSCGATIAWITEGAVRRRDSRQDLFTFWRALFDRAEGTAGYTEAMYFETLDELAGDPALTVALRHLVDEPVPQPAALVERLAIDVGLPMLRSGEGFAARAP